MSELKMKYFVLNPKSKFKDDIYAEASKRAMITYANIIKNTNFYMAQDLIDWVDAEILRNKNIG